LDWFKCFFKVKFLEKLILIFYKFKFKFGVILKAINNINGFRKYFKVKINFLIKNLEEILSDWFIIELFVLRIKIIIEEIIKLNKLLN